MTKLTVTPADSISLRQFLLGFNEEKIVCVNTNHKHSIYDNLFVLAYWECSYRPGWVFQKIDGYNLNESFPTRKEAIQAALVEYPNSEFFVFDNYLEFIKWFNVESGCGR